MPMTMQRLPPAPSHSGGIRACRYWMAGQCSRLPCPFLHDANAKASAAAAPKKPIFDDHHRKKIDANAKASAAATPKKPIFDDHHRKKIATTASSSSIVCKYFRSGRICPYGDDKCRYLHSWFVVKNNNANTSFSLLTSLQQPQPQPLPAGADDQGMMMMITGIALPSGSDKLYTGSKNGSLHAWDCHTGALAGTIHLGPGAHVGCIINQGYWIFVGIPGAVKAWNTQTTTVNSPQDLITLLTSSPANSAAASSAGQVYALAEACETLFAGTHSGNILAWRYTTSTATNSDKTIQPVASLQGHTLGVISLAVAPEIQRLYSASMDHTIRVWNLATAACIQTLTDHTSAVMSLLRWDQFLLSCSLDQTIKAWHHAAETTTGDLQAVYTHTEEHGLLALSGMLDPQGKPVLLCSSNDDTVRIYDLPSFNERGTLFSNAEIRTVHACSPGSGGPLFFTGDGAGQLRVWTWLSITGDDDKPAAAT